MNLVEKPLSIIEKAIMKSYPKYDRNRHYWSIGDIIEYEGGYTVLCVEKGGFKQHTFIVISGFNKGSKITLNIEDTPYIDKQNYRQGDMVEKLKLYIVPKTKIAYYVGAMVINNDFLMCITEVLEDGYYAFVIEEYNYNYYKNTHIYVHGKYQVE